MAIILYLFGLLMMYFVIKLGVKHAIEDSRQTIKEAILDSLAERDSYKS